MNYSKNNMKRYNVYLLLVILTRVVWSFKTYENTHTHHDGQQIEKNERAPAYNP